MNHPAVCVAIVAAAIAFGSLIVAIIGLVIAAKSYKKSKRLEFFQRRDQLFAKISDLNAKNSEVHLISARYEIVAIMKASLGLRGEQAEENAAVVARIKELRRKMEEQANNWEEKIQQLHSICSSLTPQTDAARVENLIAMVQIISDDTKKYNDINLSSLHILENTNSIIKTSLVESEEKRRQIDLDLIKAIKELTKNTEYGPANE
jgi:hypothetical protein